VFGARSRSHIGPEGFDDAPFAHLSPVPLKRLAKGELLPPLGRLNARIWLSPTNERPDIVVLAAGAWSRSIGGAGAIDGTLLRTGLWRTRALSHDACATNLSGSATFLVIHRILYSDRGMCAGVAARVSRTRYADHAQDACLLIDCLGRFRLLGARGYSHCQIGCDTAP
jgi:hypothetical protein